MRKGPAMLKAEMATGDRAASADAPRALASKRLRVEYADGQREVWPIDEADARAAQRRRCARQPLQRPTFAFRGFCARPVWPAAARPPAVAAACDALEAAFPTIEREVRDRCRALFGEDSDSDEEGTPSSPPSWASHAEGLHSGVWQKLDLWSGGRRHDVNCKQLPRTAALLESLGAVMHEAPGRCYVSLMLPGTRVEPHCGPTNHRLRLHLPLFLPNVRGRLGILVAGKLLEWVRGRCLVFDDSFEHAVDLPEAAPGAMGTPRVLLVVDLWHPQAGTLFDRAQPRAGSG